MMKEPRDSGFFVTYNYSYGSMEYYPDYIGYKIYMQRKFLMPQILVYIILGENYD